MIRRILLIAALSLLTAVTAFATVHQVPMSFATIGAALAAAGPGDVIQVAAGTYSASANGENFPLTITSDVQLLGAGMGLSILDAEGSATVVSLNAASGGRVSGFTITGGRADTGGGILVQQGDPEIDHNLIIENGAKLRGAGIFVVKQALPNCTPWIHHNVLWENFDTDLAEPTDPHGIVTAGYVLGVIENNLIGRIDGNGTLTSVNAQPTIRQNIFFENGTTAVTPPRGRGICWLSSPPAVIYHNVFWHNVLAALLWPAAGGDQSGASANVVSATDLVYGNLDADPLFVDVDALDLHLQPGSAAIDAGDPALPHDPDGTVADVGPFWFDQGGATDAPSVAGDVDGLALSIAPNPFRPSTGTTVRWSMARDGAVTIHIVDVTGRRVRTLLDGQGPAGRNEARWDGRTADGTRAASGVYLALVRAEGAARSAPMLLLQ